MHRHALALKAGFNPAQPRDEQGRWTDAAGGAIALPEIVVGADDIGLGDDELDDLLYVQLAGDVPTGDGLPQIPKERPSTLSKLIKIGRILARRYRVLELVLDAAPYLEDIKAEVRASFDPPRSLQELQEAVSSPEKGYDIHHIVERATRNPDGSEDAMINAPDNLVRIPRWKHWELNRWYETRSEDYGGLSPRQYLKGRGWDERRQVGLDGLRDVGILQ